MDHTHTSAKIDVPMAEYLRTKGIPTWSKNTRTNNIRKICRGKHLRMLMQVSHASYYSAAYDYI